MEEHRGLRNVQTFITADALLAAVLLVWGQFWSGQEIPTSMYGAAWTYCSVFLALAALAVVGWETLRTGSRPTPHVAIGLFAAALEMGALNVFQSMFKVILKLLTGTTMVADQPTHCFVGETFGFVVVILVFCILGTRSLYNSVGSESIGKYKYWLINEASVIAFSERVLCLYKESLVNEPGTAAYWGFAIGLPAILFVLTIVFLKTNVSGRWFPHRRKPN
jgi:hypothetical protein